MLEQALDLPSLLSGHKTNLTDQFPPPRKNISSDVRATRLSPQYSGPTRIDIPQEGPEREHGFLFRNMAHIIEHLKNNGWRGRGERRRYALSKSVPEYAREFHGLYALLHDLETAAHYRTREDRPLWSKIDMREARRSFSRELKTETEDLAFADVQLAPAHYFRALELLRTSVRDGELGDTYRGLAGMARLAGELAREFPDQALQMKDLFYTFQSEKGQKELERTLGIEASLGWKKIEEPCARLRDTLTEFVNAQNADGRYSDAQGLKLFKSFWLEKKGKAQGPADKSLTTIVNWLKSEEGPGLIAAMTGVDLVKPLKWEFLEGLERRGRPRGPRDIHEEPPTAVGALTAPPDPAMVSAMMPAADNVKFALDGRQVATLVYVPIKGHGGHGKIPVVIGQRNRKGWLRVNVGSVHYVIDPPTGQVFLTPGQSPGQAVWGKPTWCPASGNKGPALVVLGKEIPIDPLRPLNISMKGTSPVKIVVHEKDDDRRHPLRLNIGLVLEEHEPGMQNVRESVLVANWKPITPRGRPEFSLDYGYFIPEESVQSIGELDLSQLGLMTLVLSMNRRFAPHTGLFIDDIMRSPITARLCVESLRGLLREEKWSQPIGAWDFSRFSDFPWCEIKESLSEEQYQAFKREVENIVKGTFFARSVQSSGYGNIRLDWAEMERKSEDSRERKINILADPVDLLVAPPEQPSGSISRPAPKPPPESTSWKEQVSSALLDAGRQWLEPSENGAILSTVKDWIAPFLELITQVEHEKSTLPDISERRRLGLLAFATVMRALSLPEATGLGVTVAALVKDRRGNPSGRIRFSIEGKIYSVSLKVSMLSVEQAGLLFDLYEEASGDTLLPVQRILLQLVSREGLAKGLVELVISDIPKQSVREKLWTVVKRMHAWRIADETAFRRWLTHLSLVLGRLPVHQEWGNGRSGARQTSVSA